MPKLIRGKRMLVVAVSLLLLAGLVLSFLFFTRGKAYVQDGARVRKGITIEDARVENGVLRYTIVNRTHKSVWFWHSYPARIFKRTADGWESPNGVTLFGQQQQGRRLNRFSKIECEMELTGEELRAGEYRISHRCEYRGEAYSVLGYYTVT